LLAEATGDDRVKWYPWLTAPYRDLVAQYSSERGHHAILLQVPEFFGEELLANAVGRWLMCLNPTGEKTCGHCRGCQLMDAGTHPDWHIMMPEANKSTLGIEQIRQLTEKLYQHAQQDGVKAVWLPNCELLTDAAANALLKTLEEPPEKTYFLLSCHNAAKLLATIRSRCLQWPLTHPDENYSRQWLAKQHPEMLPEQYITALRVSGGAPLKALHLLEPTQWQSRSDLLQALVAAVNSGDLLSLLPQINLDDASERLSGCILFFMDTLKWQQNAAQYIANQDFLPALRALTQRLSPLALQQICRDWNACRHQLSAIVGVNKELLLTDLLIKTEQRYFI
jgi:DNA polymerase-3 subunit delta'